MKKHTYTIALVAALSAGNASAIDLGSLFNQATSLVNQGQSILNGTGLDGLGSTFKEIAGLAQQVQGFMGYLKQIQQANSIGDITGTACNAATSLLGSNEITGFLCQVNNVAQQVTGLLDENNWESYGKEILGDFANKAFSNIEGLLDPNLFSKLGTNLVDSINQGVSAFKKQVEYVAQQNASNTAFGAPGNQGSYTDMLVNRGLVMSGSEGVALAASMYEQTYKATESEGQVLGMLEEGEKGLENITEAVNAATLITDEAAKKAAERRAQAQNANSVREAVEVQVQAQADMYELLASFSQANLSVMANQAKLNSNTNNLLSMQMQEMYQEQQEKVDMVRKELKAGADAEVEQYNQTVDRLKTFQYFNEQTGTGRALKNFKWSMIEEGVKE